LSLVSEFLVIDAGDFDVDVDTVDERAADFLVVAGDRYGGTTTFLDGVAVEAAGTGVRVAVIIFIRFTC
jgi:hypothetical protein